MDGDQNEVDMNDNVDPEKPSEEGLAEKSAEGDEKKLKENDKPSEKCAPGGKRQKQKSVSVGAFPEDASPKTAEFTSLSPGTSPGHSSGLMPTDTPVVEQGDVAGADGQASLSRGSSLNLAKKKSMEKVRFFSTHTRQKEKSKEMRLSLSSSPKSSTSDVDIDQHGLHRQHSSGGPQRVLPATPDDSGNYQTIGKSSSSTAMAGMRPVGSQSVNQNRQRSVSTSGNISMAKVPNLGAGRTQRGSTASSESQLGAGITICLPASDECIPQSKRGWLDSAAGSDDSEDPYARVVDLLSQVGITINVEDPYSRVKVALDNAPGVDVLDPYASAKAVLAATGTEIAEKDFEVLVANTQYAAINRARKKRWLSSATTTSIEDLLVVKEMSVSAPPNRDGGLSLGCLTTSQRASTFSALNMLGGDSRNGIYATVSVEKLTASKSAPTLLHEVDSDDPYVLAPPVPEKTAGAAELQEVSQPDTPSFLKLGLGRRFSAPQPEDPYARVKDLRGQQTAKLKEDPYSNVAALIPGAVKKEDPYSAVKKEDPYSAVKKEDPYSIVKKEDPYSVVRTAGDREHDVALGASLPQPGSLPNAAEGPPTPARTVKTEEGEHRRKGSSKRRKSAKGSVSLEDCSEASQAKTKDHKHGKSKLREVFHLGGKSNEISKSTKKKHSFDESTDLKSMKSKDAVHATECVQHSKSNEVVQLIDSKEALGKKEATRKDSKEAVQALMTPRGSRSSIHGSTSGMVAGSYLLRTSDTTEINEYTLASCAVDHFSDWSSPLAVW